MKKNDFFVEVPVVDRKGETRNTYCINVSNVLYYRDWPLKDSDQVITAIYVVGGKEIKVPLSKEEIEKIFTADGEKDGISEQD